MKRTIMRLIKVLSFVIPACILLASCKKELDRKPFKLTSETFYRISPKTPETISINGANYVGFAFFPGGGEGTASYLGDIKIYFNQQVYGESSEAPPLGSVAAPIKDVLNYPILGGPLPLIQTGDFAELAVFHSTLPLPSIISGMIVNTVIYNRQGDALFLSAITGAGATFPISQTVVGFNGRAWIVEGRGKFKNSSGEVDYHGSFSLVNPDDATFDMDGWISY
ncbi:MAG: hypothetical protein ABIN89_09580 [Chitinophagaceae bacterium]